MPQTERISKAIPCRTIEELGAEFYDPVLAAEFPQALPRYWNDPLVAELGWREDFSLEETRIQHFQRFQPIPGSLPQPLALRYHGHQFQHYNPDLGDGRGFLFAQIKWRKNLWDFGTKGSGQTPYSRRGDGRLTLKGAVREALATEMLESLGVNTSRTFSFFETGEFLQRNDEPSPTRAAVLTRFSHSHIRLGTFQRLAYFQNKEALEKLLRYSARHLLTNLDDSLPLPELIRAFVPEVARRLASLSSQWMIAGFVHGVLNTDNLNITGESFDYGPYRFLPSYDPGFTAAYFDHAGLYAYGRQPASVLWALQRFAEGFSVLDENFQLEEALQDFPEIFSQSLGLMLCHRLNVLPAAPELTLELVRSFFQFQESESIAFEQTFFDLFRGAPGNRREKSPQKNSYDTKAGWEMLLLLEKFEIESSSRVMHPGQKRETPVTLLIDEIEAIWAGIAGQDDWNLFNQKIAQIRSLRGVFDLKDL